MIEPRAEPKVIAYKDGKVVVFGGCQKAVIETFNVTN